MKNLKKALKKGLKEAKKIAILGIGSDLRRDDAVGEFTAREIGLSVSKKAGAPRLKVFLGSTAPENITGQIKRYKPSHIVIIDSADMGKKPGSAGIIREEKTGGMSFLTHKMPAKVLVDYLKSSLGCQVIIIGIQPKSVEFGMGLSKEAEKAGIEVSRAVKEAILLRPSTRKQR